MSSIYTANQTAVSELYIALLGRNPEQEGYAFWVNKLNGGETQLQAAAEMAYAPEFFSTYGALNTQQAIERIYVNVFERTGDVNGIAYWTARANALISAGTPTVVAYAQTATNMIVAGYTNNSTDTPLIQARVDAASADGTAEPSVTHTLTTSQFVYGGTQANDIYNAPLETLGNAAVMTLQPFTSIDGAGGTNTVNAILNGSVTPLALTNIQLVNATTSDTATLGLVNASSLTRVANIASSAALTVSGIAAGADLASVNTASASVFQYATTTGAAESADLLLQNSTGAVTIAGIETINITSVGTSANSTSLTAANATTINIDPTSTGDQALTLTGAAVATLIDATGFNANFTGTLTVAGTLNGGLGNDTLTGGVDVAAVISGNDGNDSIVAGAASTAHSDSMSGGAGDDTITFAAGFIAGNATAALNDSVDGGAGVNTLVLTAANAEGVVNASTTIDNIQVLSLSTAGQSGATLQADKIDSSIATVNLGAGTAAAYTVNFNAGASTLNLADAAAGNLSVAETGGTGTTDSLIISNTQTTGTDDSFGGTLSSAGFESLTIVTGAVATATQAITTLTLNGETAASTPTTLTVSGVNTLDISTVLTTSNTGLTTVNASGLTGAAYLDIDEVAAGTGGTFSITGSDGNDLLGSSGGTLGNFKTTITAGAGNDVIYTGTAIDSVQGGLGNDLIVGGGGNDVLKGNEGNDSITGSSAADNIDGGAGDDTITTGSSITAASTINGGEGNDTLVVTAAITSPSVGARITNIEILSTTASSQDLSMFTATTLTTVVDEAASLTLTNAASTLTGISLDATATTLLSMARDVDTSSNSVTLTATGTVDIDDVTLANEETITIDTNAAAFTIGTAGGDVFTANDLTTLTVNGDNDVIITNAIVGSTALATISNNLTGTAVFTVNATNSTTGITFTASTSTGTTTLTTGSGADNVTAGSGIIVAVTGSGADTVLGGALDDTITGGAGADSVTGGAGDDTFLVGTTLTDWAVGDYVAGGAGDLDVLEFGASGVITYVDRTISGVEVLTLLDGTPDNAVTVTQGTGLVTVNNLISVGDTFTLNQATSVFGAAAGSAAAVDAAGEWYYAAVNSDTDGALTYWDEILSEAVLITLVGSEDNLATSVAVVGGNLVATVAA